MSTRETELPPVDPELEALFAAERARPQMPASVAARLLHRGSMAVLVGSAIPGGDAPPAPPTEPVTSVARKLAGSAVRSAVTAFAVGSIVGAGVYANVRPAPAPKVVVVTVPASASAEPRHEPLPALVPSVSPSASAPPEASTEAPAPRTGAATPGPRGTGDPTLAAERASIEIARAALGRGDADSALMRLQEHARRFPNGQLAEERESLWVQALVIAGRPADAQARARRFYRQYPESMFRPAVETTLRSISQRNESSSPKPSADAPPAPSR